MNYIIAGVVALLGFFAVAAAALTIPIYEKADKGTEADSAAPAIKLKDYFNKANYKNIMLAATFSCALAGVTGATCVGAQDPFTSIRLGVLLAVLEYALLVDIKLCIIPNIGILVSLGIYVLIELAELIFTRGKIADSLVKGIVGALACLVIFYILSRLTKDGMGMGDIKLIAVMGLYLGFAGTLLSVIVALVLCCVVSVFLLLGRKKNKDDSVPFGPFLFFGYIVALIFFV